MKETCFVYYLIMYYSPCVICGQQPKYNISFIGDCDIPEGQYAPKPIKHFATIATVKRKQILQLNFTVDEKTLPVMNTIRGFKLVQNRKQLGYTIPNLTCTNPVTSVVWKKLHLKYDKSCCLLPGIVVQDNLSLDDLISNQQRAGAWDSDHSIFDFQFHTRKGVLLCISIQIDML